MKLNIGCGSDSWGDIRLDIVREYFFLEGESQVNFVGDARFLPFKDKSFDEVLVRHVLEHILDWEKALAECCRVAKKLFIIVPENSSIPKSGWFVLFTNPFISLLHRHKRKCFSLLLKLPKRARQHIWQFDVEILKLMLHKQGFEQIHIKLGGKWLGFLPLGEKARYFGFPIEWTIIAE